MFIHDSYKIHNSNDMSEFIKSFDVYKPTWSDLLTIDYFYYHHESTYDNGLSFIDRLNKKLGTFHPEWDIPAMKKYILESSNPSSVYVRTIQYMLSDSKDIVYYGI